MVWDWKEQVKSNTENHLVHFLWFCDGNKKWLATLTFAWLSSTTCKCILKASRKAQILLRFWLYLCYEVVLSLSCYYSLVAYQVGLEFIEVNIEGSVKPGEDTKINKLVIDFLRSGLPQGCSDWWDDLSNQAVEVCVRWRWDLKVVLAQIIDRLPIAIDQFNIEWKQEGLP